MKRIDLLIGLMVLSLSLPLNISAQCVPDEGCEDIDEPGQICPARLPDGILNNAYNEVITVIPPGTFVYNGSPINIGYITIDSIINLPPGIVYEPNKPRFFPDTSYCVAITGTPTAEGDFDIAIYVGVYVMIMSDYVKVTTVM